MSLANLISLLRILAIPFLIYLVRQDTYQASFVALIVFAFAVLTDIADGIVARRTKQTRIGYFLDPFADKLLIMSLLIYFVYLGGYWVLFLAIFVIRDLIVGFVRWMAGKADVHLRGKRTYGNLLSYSQFLIIFGLLLEPFFEQGGLLILLATGLAVLLSLISSTHFFFSYLKGLSKQRRKGRVVKKEPMEILANKRSRGYHDGYRRHLLELFAHRRNAQITFLPNTKNMFKNVKPKTNHVIIAGGDGTFEAALHNKAFYKKTLGFFPLGAGNAFWSYFYKGKRYKYLRSRFPFREIKQDVLELEWEKGKTQTLFMNIGIDAEVIRLSSKRTQHGFFDYFRGSTKAIARSKADYELDVEVDGKKEHWDNCVGIFIGKMSHLGFGLRALFGRVDSDDGKVYGSAIINAHSVWFNKPLRIWALILGMMNLNRSPYHSLKGKKITVRSDVPFPIQAGGEFLGYTHWIRITVKRKQKMLVL